MILERINGKVPVAILDQFLSFRGVDKAINKVRSALENEFYRTYPKAMESANCYYPTPVERDHLRDVTKVIT